MQDLPRSNEMHAQAISRAENPVDVQFVKEQARFNNVGDDTGGDRPQWSKPWPVGLTTRRTHARAGVAQYNGDNSSGGTVVLLDEAFADTEPLQ